MIQPPSQFSKQNVSTGIALKCANLATNCQENNHKKPSFR